jgi:hypothetical protein
MASAMPETRSVVISHECINVDILSWSSVIPEIGIVGGFTFILHYNALHMLDLESDGVLNDAGTFV